jgi:hypothetical protein
MISNIARGLRSKGRGAEGTRREHHLTLTPLSTACPVPFFKHQQATPPQKDEAAGPAVRPDKPQQR